MRIIDENTCGVGEGFLNTRARKERGLPGMFRRSLILTLIAWLSCLVPALASGDGGHHAPPLYAEPVADWLPLTNSMLMSWVAVGLIVFFCRMATGKMSLIPQGLQNFSEWIVESLYDFLGGLLGDHLNKRVFWFLGSVFFFILVNNYLGLIPFIGNLGWPVEDPEGHQVGWLPLLRGGNADVNMTAAMAFTFAVLWFYWAITENGVKGFLAHIFAPKGNFGGLMRMLMIPIFLFVGVLEIVSICIRPVALTFRLFGNIYGGETTIETLAMLGKEAVASKVAGWPGWLQPLAETLGSAGASLPIYFLELLVGFIQSLVFTLLCAIFIKLICDHGDEEHSH